MKLLVVEDDRVVRITVRDAFAEAGYDVVACSDGTSALRVLESESIDIVVSDVRLPGLSGIDLFRRIRNLQPNAGVVLMTGFANSDDAVTVMREGARDYIAKPFEIEELLLRVARIAREIEFRRELEQPRAQEHRSGRLSVTGTSPAAEQLRNRIEMAAQSDVNILITGETGTGKDRCAQMIHERSGRHEHPFVAVSCAAIPETLLEAELFGHEKGAFTGASRRRSGRFAVAHRGTLFLDEIGELSLASQIKLLRVLETSRFEPLGSSQTVEVDVRIISATNRDLKSSMDAGLFRKDLFYRLNVIDIETPPLRARRPDIPSLVSAFLDQIAARQSRERPGIDPSAMAALVAYDYPGNVRELIHALEHATAMARAGNICLDHLPDDFHTAAGPASPETPKPLPSGQIEPLARALEQFEDEYVRAVLYKVGGHRAQAANLLGISRKSLWEKLKRRSGGR